MRYIYFQSWKALLCIHIFLMLHNFCYDAASKIEVKTSVITHLQKFLLFTLTLLVEMTGICPKCFKVESFQDAHNFVSTGDRICQNFVSHK